MSLFSWLFGKSGERADGSEGVASSEAPRPSGRPALRFTLGIGTRKRAADRRTAEHFLLAAGRYELYLTTSGRGAYAPRGSSALLPDGGWRNRVHMLFHTPIYPLEAGAPEATTDLPHRVFQNEDDPGPFRGPLEARQAFRRIPAEQRRFELLEPTRVVFWVEMDETPADGTMTFELFEVD